MNKYLIAIAVILIGNLSAARLYGLRIAMLSMLPGYVIGVPEFEYDVNDLDDNYTLIYGLGMLAGTNDGGFGFSPVFGTYYYFQHICEGPYIAARIAFGFALRDDPEEPGYVFSMQADNLSLIGISGGYRYLFENHIDVSAELGVFGGKMPFVDKPTLVPAINLSVGLYF